MAKLEILDCSEISGNLEDIKSSKEFQNFAQKLGTAMTETGFVYLINHDLDEKVVDEIFSKSRDFFRLPNEVKSKYLKRNPAENFHGYSSAGQEKVSYVEGLYKDHDVTDFKECFDCWGTLAHDNSNFPAEIPGFKTSVDLFRSSLVDLASKILYAFATFLNLEDGDFFFKQHQALLANPTIKSHSFIRSNYYFPIDSELVPTINRDDLRLGEHCDVDTMSFLVQDAVGGLEAKHPTAGWIQVTPIPGSIVLNVGSVMEVWSGGNLLSTPHRVRVMPGTANVARQSAALFVQPDGHVKFSPVVPEKADWIPSVVQEDPELPHFQFFSNVIKQVRPEAY